MAHQSLSKSWFHKNLSRKCAEELLMETKREGAFLVRESESLPETRVLCVLMQNEVHHYKIIQSIDGNVSLQTLQGVEQHFFESMEHLISYYKASRDPREFKIPLTEPVPAEGSLADDGNDPDSDFEDDMDGEESIGKFFMLQMEATMSKMQDPQFHELLNGYIKNGLPRDLKKIENGATSPPFLQKMLATAAGDLYKSLALFEKRLGYLKDLFDVGENESSQAVSPQRRKFSLLESKGMQQYTGDFESTFNLLESCKTQMLSLERKSCRILKEYSSNSKQDMSSPEETYEVLPSTRGMSVTHSRYKHGICQFFQVSKGNRKNKIFLSVNMKDGKVSFLKSPDEPEDMANTFALMRINQLLKDKASKTNLGITVDKKTTTYSFEDFKSRELFCQLIEHMKEVPSGKTGTESNQLSVFVGTWNMANAQPPEDISSWLKCLGGGKLKDFDPDNPYDIVALGTQIAKWSLWDIRLVIFVRPLHISKINYLKQSVVKTGIANTLGNKGAVGISFVLGKTSFCFVNCHLSARTARIARRNQNFHDILRGLNLGQDNVFDISCYFHHLFWFGDLNYRIHNIQIEDVIKKISKNELSNLQEYDQLAMEKRNGNAFFGFEEEVAKFRPTYRYKIGCNNSYIWLKRKPGAVVLTNLPSWCDRVLWKSFPEMFITNTSYGATENICTSDHAPVFATFDVGVISHTSSPACHSLNPNTEHVKIEFLEIKAKLRTSCKTKFIVTFQSTCLEKTVNSRPNSIENCNYENKSDTALTLFYSFPCWQETDLPKLVPALSYQGYLEDQHLLIAIKGDDGHESYGECVLSLKRLLRSSTDEFSACLTHLGDESGELRGRAKIDLPVKQRRRSVVQAVAAVDPLTVNLKSDRSIRNSIYSNKCENYTPQNYEVVGGFSDKTDFESDVPALPPKKRLSQSSSNPLLPPSSPRVETTSDVIWLGDPEINEIPNNDNAVRKITKEVPPPPLPQRQHSDMTFSAVSTSEERPTPKPRTAKSFKQNSPQSIKQWLEIINCSQYYEALCEAGWDDLGYLDFDDNDLQEAGIYIAEHRQTDSQSDGSGFVALCSLAFLKAFKTIMVRKVLVAVDGSDNAERAFQFYMDNVYREGDLLNLVHITSTPHLPAFSFEKPMSFPVEEWQGKLQKQVIEAQELVGQFEALCESRKIAKKPHIVAGSPGEKICEIAENEKVSFIIIGSRGLNALRRTFTGSVSDYVLRHAGVPVTIVPPKKN
eukprot:gene11283-12463_t